MFAFNRSNKRSFENETHAKLATLLLDEYVQVLSSFELNQIASLTYGTEVCDEIFEMLEEVLGKPLDYTTLALQKSLVVAKHILIYGSEECVRNSIALGRLVEPLQIYNTVLLQQQRQGATALFYRIKGGGVDKGYPVREAAKQFYDLVANPDQVHHLRHTHADPNSLVPVGDDKVVFVTDEVRLYLLKKRMDEQQRIQAKSNLAKAEDGFGGGYMSKDGKAVVGAAHGIEEMLAKDKREKMKYRDDGVTPYQAPKELLDDARAAAAVGGVDDLLSSTTTASSVAAPRDLLDFSSSPQPTKAAVSVDLLGHDLLGSGSTPLNGSTTATGDLLLGGGGGGGLDLLGVGHSHTNGGSRNGNGVVDFLGVTTTSTTTAAMSSSTTTAMTSPLDLLGMPPTIGTNVPPSQTTTVNIGNSIFNVHNTNSNGSQKASIMSSGAADPFSALDALGVPASKPTSTHLFAGVADAEQRSLGLAAAKDPLLEINGLPADMTKLSLINSNMNNNKPIVDSLSGHSMPKWGGIMDDGGMSSDSESHGFGGAILGGGGGTAMKPIQGGLLTSTTTFGLSSSMASTAMTTTSSDSDPFSSLSQTTKNNHDDSNIPSFAMPVMSSMASTSVMPDPILPPAHGGMGVSSTFGGDEMYENTVYDHNPYVGDEDDNDSGFVMGGMVGSGLQPTAPPPPVPPPPPPAF